MNSAVQVIANISQIYEYFVSSQQYKDQINTKAAMGNKGLLAVGFGNLMN
jgi:ubiquitin C-terminal hydrolase